MLCQNLMSAVRITTCMLSFSFWTNLERNKVVRFGKEKTEKVHQIICFFALSHSSSYYFTIVRLNRGSKFQHVRLLQLEFSKSVYLKKTRGALFILRLFCFTCWENQTLWDINPLFHLTPVGHTFSGIYKMWDPLCDREKSDWNWLITISETLESFLHSSLIAKVRPKLRFFSPLI